MQPETLWTRVQPACSARQVGGKSISLDETRVQPAVESDDDDDDDDDDFAHNFRAFMNLRAQPNGLTI